MTDSTIMSWSVQAVNITMRALGAERPGNQASIRTTSGGGWECGMSRRVGILLLGSDWLRVECLGEWRRGARRPHGGAVWVACPPFGVALRGRFSPVGPGPWS